MACLSEPESWNTKYEVDPTRAWSALLNGYWQVLEHDARRPVHTILCHPHRGPRVATLSLLAIRMAKARARGAALKEVAADAGRSMATVSRLLAGVRRTLDLRSDAQLVALFDRVSGEDVVPPPPGATASIERSRASQRLVLTYMAPRWSLPPCLSPVERAVVGDLIEGMSSQGIAHARRTSPRTVANQIGSIFRKVGVNSRVELFAVLHSYHAEGQALLPELPANA